MKTVFEAKWIPFGESWPPERKLVLVWMKDLYLPFLAYMRYAAGDKNSPFFVTPLFNADEWDGERPEITHWCDCIPIQAFRAIPPSALKRWNVFGPVEALS